MSRTSATITPFPQTPFSQENEENQREVSQSVVSSSTTTRARAREEFLAEVEPYYCQTFGTASMPPVAQGRVMVCLNRGMEESLIYTAIDEAAMAPRPSWAYANAILTRLLQEECLTAQAYIDRQERWANRRGRRY